MAPGADAMNWDAFAAGLCAYIGFSKPLLGAAAAFCRTTRSATVATARTTTRSATTTATKTPELSDVLLPDAAVVLALSSTAAAVCSFADEAAVPAFLPGVVVPAAIVVVVVVVVALPPPQDAGPKWHSSSESTASWYVSATCRQPSGAERPTLGQQRARAQAAGRHDDVGRARTHARSFCVLASRAAFAFACFAATAVFAASLFFSLVVRPLVELPSRAFSCLRGSDVFRGRHQWRRSPACGCCATGRCSNYMRRAEIRP